MQDYLYIYINNGMVLQTRGDVLSAKFGLCVDMSVSESVSSFHYVVQSKGAFRCLYLCML